MAYIDKFIDALYRLSADQLEVSSGRRVILGVGDTRRPVTARPATAEQVNWLLREIRSGTLDVLDEESEHEQFVYSAPAGIVRISVERVDGLPLIRIMPYGVDEALLTESEGTAESADAEANGGPGDSTADESLTDSQAGAAATSSEAVEPIETSELNGPQMAVEAEEGESDSEEPAAVASFEDEQEASEAEEQVVVATSEAEEEMPEAEQSVAVAISEAEQETSDSEEQEAVATLEEEEVNARQDELTYAETEGTDISAETETPPDDAEDEGPSAESEEDVTHEVEVVPLASAESSAATLEPVDSPEAEYDEDPEYAGLVTAARAAFSAASAEPEPPIRPVRILVTEPSDDAADLSLVAEAEGATTEAGDAAVIEIDAGADGDAQGYSQDGDGDGDAYGYTQESESAGSDVSEYTATTSVASEGPTVAEAPAGEDISEVAEAEASPYLAAAFSYSPESDAGASWYDRVYQESATEVDDSADGETAAENDGGADLDSAAESVQAETQETPIQSEDDGTTFQDIEPDQTDDTAQPDEAGDPSLAMHEEPTVTGDEGDGHALGGVVEPEEFEDEVGETTAEAEVGDVGDSEMVAAVEDTEATAVAEEGEAEDLESYAEAVADAHEDSGLPEAMSGDFEAAAVADFAGEYAEEASDHEAYAEEAHPAEAYAEEAYAEAADPEEGAEESDLGVTEEEAELAPEGVMDEAEVPSSEILEAEAPSETEDADQGVEGEAAASMAASLTPGERLEVLFRRMVDEGWTDLHVSPGVAPLFRRNGELLELEDEALTTQEAREMLLAFLSTEKLRELDLSSHVDFVLEVPEVGRFRCNLFEDHRGWGGLMRVISSEVPTVESLGLPVEIVELCELSEGLVLITGARGSGKSRTLAGMIDYINRTRANRVVTFEDPIEFVHANQNSLISQREIGAHNEKLADALRAALRENPDVIVLGEMRDLETVETAIEAAEMGHLVFATLPTRTAASTVDRILEQFPAGRQSRVRTMLAASLKAVISQTLVAAKGGGKVAALEFLPVTRTVSNLIREGNTYQIPGVLERGIDEGMRPLNHVLLELVKYGKVEPAAAYAAAVDKKELESLFSREGIEWMRDPWRRELEEAGASDEPSHA